MPDFNRRRNIDVDSFELTTIRKKINARNPPPAENIDIIKQTYMHDVRFRIDNDDEIIWQGPTSEIIGPGSRPFF